MKTLKRITLAGLAALVLGTTACGRDIETKTINVDQVFTNHNGYTLTYVDESNRINEVKVVNGCGGLTEDELKKVPEDVLKKLKAASKEGASVYKDLDETQKPYAFVIKKKPDSWSGEYVIYAEIHLPKEEKLLPGTDAYKSNKHTRPVRRHEIK